MAGKKKIKKILDRYINDQSNVRTGNDVPEYMLHTKRQDAHFFFGIKINTETTEGMMNNDTHDIVRYVGKPQDYDGHVMVVGGAGSGKSSCIVIPTLETWGGTFFAIDIKGELTAHWNRLEGAAGHKPAKIFNLSNERSIFSTYDPFHFMRQDWEDNLVQNAREIAHAIIPLPPSVTEPFWIQSAQHVLTAALLHGFGIGASFNATLTRIQTTPIWELIDEISKGDNLAAQMHINQFSGIENPSENKMLTGISAELSNKVMIFVTDLRIKDALSPSDELMKWEDLETHNIFMTIAEDKLGQWDGAISMLLTQLIRTLERRPDRYSDDGLNNTPVLLLLDEFPRLGKVGMIENAVSTLRSKGVTICLVMQSLAQLDRTYGKVSRQIIVDNCQYKAILNVTDSENQKIFSDMIGSITVTSGTISLDSNKDNSDYTLQFGESREPILHPHELATLEDVVLMTPKGFCRVTKAPYYNEPRRGKPVIINQDNPQSSQDDAIGRSSPNVVNLKINED